MTLLSSAAAVSPDLLRGRMESSRRPSALARAAILSANCYTCVTFIKNLVVWTTTTASSGGDPPSVGHTTRCIPDHVKIIILVSLAASCSGVERDSPRHTARYRVQATHGR